MLDWITDNAALLVLIGMVIGLTKLIHYVFHTSRTFKVSSLELLHKAMGEADNVTSELIAEQIFQSHFKIKTDYKTIKRLLSHSSPSTSISLYKTAFRYLDTKSEYIVLRKKFNTPRKIFFEAFIRRPFVNVSLYFVFAMLSGACVIIANELFDSETLLEIHYFTYNWALLLLLLVSSIVFGLVAIKCLVDDSSIKNAEKLVTLFNSPKPKSKVWGC